MMAEQETAMASPSSEEKVADFKKLSRLALARRAASMESELTRSSRWHLSPEHPDAVPRSVSLDAQVSTSSLDIDSLRKLEASPVKSGVRSSTMDGDSDRSKERSVKKHFPGAASMSSSASHVSACRLPPSRQGAPEAASGSIAVSDTSRRQSAPRIERPSSIRQGVDESTINALSQLGRRRQKVEAPSIILPSNRPFLIGERAKGLHQREVEGNETSVPTDESVIHGSAKTFPTENNPRKEAPNITLLSKLLFFGGATPHKATKQSTPDAATLSPDETMISQPDSCSIEHSYLLQLGHIMGEVSPQLPLQPRLKDLDETASTVSSLEHFCSVAPGDIEFAPDERHYRFRRFLFFAAFLMITCTSFREMECTFSAYYRQTKQALAPFARQGYNVAVNRVEHLVEEAHETVHAKAVDLAGLTMDWVDGYIDTKEAFIALKKWHKLTMGVYVTAMDFIMEPTKPPEEIIRPGNQYTIHYPWNLPNEISTTVVVSQRTVRSETSAPVAELTADTDPSNDGGNEDTHDENPASTDRREITSDVSESLAGGIAVYAEAEVVAPETKIPTDPVQSDDEAGDSTSFSDSEAFTNILEPLEGTATTTMDTVEETTVFRANETGSSCTSAKDRLQAAAKQDLLQAMGRHVTTQLKRPRSSSFSLSLMAQIAFLPGACVDDSSVNYINAIPLMSRKLVASNTDERFRRTQFDEIFGCFWSEDEVMHQYSLAGKSICRATESVVEEDVAVPDEETHLVYEEEDEFLQKPLVEIVGDFFRERKKRKQQKRKHKKRAIEQSR